MEYQTSDKLNSNAMFLRFFISVAPLFRHSIQMLSSYPILSRKAGRKSHNSYNNVSPGLDQNSNLHLY